MPKTFNRREAVAGMGAVTLSSLLAACGNDSSSGTASTSVSTTMGSTATVDTKTTATADLFDDTSSCTLTVEETEGPYYFDVDSIRSDITEDKDGTALRLAIRVREAGECKPIEDAVVDIWHCDAGGVYSGFESASNRAGGGSGGPPPGPPPDGGGGDGGPGGGSEPTDDKTYLRGAQVTNSDGIVVFKTVYPGWYQGRTVHIHAKVHIDKKTVLTTQLFFDEQFTEKVYASKPYSDDTGRDVFNDDDNIFDESLILKLSEEGDGTLGVISFDVQTA